LNPATFGGLSDWARLPILHESDLPATADWAVAPESWWVRTDALPGRPSRVVTDGDAIQQADLAARALWAAGARPGQPLRIGRPGLFLMTRPAIVAGANRIQALLDGSDLSLERDRVVPFSPPFIFTCFEGEAVHWNDDHFLIEVVDPATGEAVEPGVIGAVLITDLTREGSPLLRFWTRQSAAVTETICDCGRTLPQSRSITGRH